MVDYQALKIEHQPEESGLSVGTSSHEGGEELFRLQYCGSQGLSASSLSKVALILGKRRSLSYGSFSVCI